MNLIFSPQRLSEFQNLYKKIYGIKLSETEAEQKLSALVAMLIACHRGSAGSEEGRDSNPAPVRSCKKHHE